MENPKYIVISLGGSIMVPNEIDIEFLTAFASMIKEYVATGHRFVLITGGGKVCRKYQHALSELTEATNKDLDWLGIYTTQLNAQFMRLVFGDLAYEEIVTDISLFPDTQKPIILGAGHRPGASTDLNAVLAAEKTGAKKIINLSNIQYAYDKDPKTFPDAIKIEQASWADFRKILPVEWNPGLNAPFDPIAAERAEALDLEVAIMDGKNIENLRNYLNGEAFIGSVIK
jgi:uridylate kinase